MVKNKKEIYLDDVDKAALRLLQKDGRLSNVELSRSINLSPPATHSRMKRLESKGFIRQYTAIVDREKAGYDLLCFIHVSLQMHRLKEVEAFQELTRQMPEVLECHHITGEYDYLLKVVLRNRKDLERFVVEKLTPIPGMARIQTSIVFTEVKSTMSLPLE